MCLSLHEVGTSSLEETFCCTQQTFIDLILSCLVRDWVSTYYTDHLFLPKAHNNVLVMLSALCQAVIIIFVCGGGGSVGMWGGSP